MTKFFISGPMSGVPDFNYPTFESAAAYLRSKGLDVVSPHELHDGNMGHGYAYYLRRDLRALLDCDVLVQLPGWRESRGAVVEYEVAQALCMLVMDMQRTDDGVAQPDREDPR